MRIEILQEKYESNGAIRAICEIMESRTNNQNESKLHRIIKHLEEKDYDFNRATIIEAFRELEKSECGRYVEGRHGWPSRFVWSVPSLLVAKTVKSGEEPQEQEYEDKNEDELIEHSFVLRQGLTISIELPSDITSHEAYRLSQFVKSLSFEE